MQLRQEESGPGPSNQSVQSANPAIVQSLPRGRRRCGAGRGFTLVEVMVATVLLSMIILGILSVLIGSYRVAAKARFNDHARYVIKSLSDQFLTQQTTDTSGNTLTMFQTTVDPNAGPNFGNQTPLGTGVSWTNSDGSTGTLTAGSYGYNVLLGDNTGAPVTATVTRSVWYLYDSTGQPTLLSQNKSAGYMLEGDFTITYPVFGRTQSQTITNVRAVP
jgi:prepilin-type N-terminal cleavage/methylation domain-containing protein